MNLPKMDRGVAQQFACSMPRVAAEAEGVVRELLNRDASLSGLEVTSAGLEDAFIELTKSATDLHG